MNRAMVRRLTSGTNGEPRWAAEVKGTEHEVVVKGRGPARYLWCVTCQSTECAGVTVVAPHAAKEDHAR